MKDLIQLMYSEMVNADKEAFEIMGEAIYGKDKDIELKFDRLSTKAVSIEKLLLDFADKDKIKELIDNAMKSDDINYIKDCFIVVKKVEADEKGFHGWKPLLCLYTHAHEMLAEEFWNMYKNYI